MCMCSGLLFQVTPESFAYNVYGYLEVAMLTKKNSTKKFEPPKKCGEYIVASFLLKWPTVQNLQHDALFQQLNFSRLLKMRH